MIKIVSFNRKAGDFLVCKKNIGVMPISEKLQEQINKCVKPKTKDIIEQTRQ